MGYHPGVEPVLVQNRVRLNSSGDFSVKACSLGIAFGRVAGEAILSTSLVVSSGRRILNSKELSAPSLKIRFVVDVRDGTSHDDGRHDQCSSRCVKHSAGDSCL